MKELDDERDKQIADMRKEYMEKIKGTKDTREKERLLEEMGKRMNQIEQQRTDERARQEATLKKMLKDRQKKQIKKEVKDIEKQIDAIETDIDKIRQEVDEDKAKAYADEGASGLIDNDIKTRKDKLFDKVAINAGFMNQLNDQEKDDIRIQQARLQMEKDKELRSAEATIDERINQEALEKLNLLEDEQIKKRK